MAQPAGHVLDPYVEYWFLINRLARPEETDFTPVRDFLQRQQGSYLAEKLRADWIRQAAKRGDWQVVQAEYPRLEQPEQDSTCYSIQARLRSGDVNALEAARPLWLTLLDVSDACQPVLQALAEDGRTTPDDLWWRFRRMIEAKRPGSARATAAWLPEEQQPPPGSIESLMSNPEAWLDRQPVNFSTTRPGRELALAALARLSRDDPAAALLRFNRIDERFPAAERSYAYSVLAWQGAQKLLPEANAWYKAAGEVPLSEDQRAWQVRAALRAGDWRSVRHAIENMPTVQRELPEWSYWLGRARTSLGQRDAARRLFEREAGHPTFYGILSGEELGHTFELPPKPV
ncbi:MAG: transglycosylase, partial [Zoogloea sp.]|nr:transglycosylase [Zoogloea sp.]